MNDHELNAVPVRGDLMNEIDAASYLGLSRRTLQQWRVSGRGPCFRKLGAAVRYRRQDLDAFVDGATRSSTCEVAR